MNKRISNQEFLTEFGKGTLLDVILPDELELIELKLNSLAGDQEVLIKTKIDTAEQSGDNWHDGAFRATDDAAKIIFGQVNRLSQLRSSTIVEYPDTGETRATLGSRVTLRQNDTVYDVDIVGVSTLYEQGTNEVMPCSIESPVAKAIIGKIVGQIAMLHVASRRQEIEIMVVDQEIVRESLTNVE